MKSSFGALEKKVPQNAKYQNVQARLDTGPTVRNQTKMSDAEIARRRNEPFKRIKPATLARLVHDHQEEAEENIFDLASVDRDAASVSSVKASRVGPRTVMTAASCGSVVAGSVLSVVDTDTTVDEARQLVVLDLRPAEDFTKCHVPLAVSYPATMISRDQFIPELQRCKRDESKLLVVYHVNDAETARIATLLLHKGWETVHALSGGFEEMVASYPEVLEGEVPEIRQGSASRPPLCPSLSGCSRPTSGSTVRSASSTGARSMQRSAPGSIRRAGSIPRRAGSVRRG